MSREERSTYKLDNESSNMQKGMNEEQVVNIQAVSEASLTGSSCPRNSLAILEWKQPIYRDANRQILRMLKL